MSGLHKLPIISIILVFIKLGVHRIIFPWGLLGLPPMEAHGYDTWMVNIYTIYGQYIVFYKFRTITVVLTVGTLSLYV